MRRVAHLTHTVLCFGLNYAIPAMRKSPWAKYVLGLVILNELRGLYVVYTMWDQIPWAR